MKMNLLPSTLSGLWQMPPSKSVSHRLLIAAALANGDSSVSGLDYSDDIHATIGALRAMGATINCVGSTAQVQGCNPAKAHPSSPVFCGESGSTLRLILPLFGLSSSEVSFSGAQRLFARPQHVYQRLFTQQNLRFDADANGITIQGSLQAGSFTLEGNVSSQFISGLLFALPLAAQNSVLHITSPFESKSYVALTQEAQAQFGVISTWQDENTLVINGAQSYTPASVMAESDWSQGAVGAVLAACRFGQLGLTGLAKSAQGDRVILSILERCGAKHSNKNGALYFTSPQEGLASPGDIDISDCPDLGPILCTLALFCKGTTRIINAARLRIKESDRIASVQQELTRLGAHIDSTADSITIEGGHALHSGQTLSSHSDHRVVMCTAAASLIAGLNTQIDGAQNIAKSWPSFFTELRALGAQMEEM